MPPRGSPRNKKTAALHDPRKHEQHRASPSSGTYTTTRTHTVSPVEKNSLQVPETFIPRFGEQRSPSNVRDWLELHDLFDIEEDGGDNFPKPQQVSPKTKAHSVTTAESVRSYKSVRSTNRSENIKHLPRVDLFQRRSSFISRSGVSSVGSIVRNFPPIRQDDNIATSDQMISKTKQPRHQKEKLKHKKYLQYADMALDDCGAEQEDNLLQSMSAFIEVKRDIEKTRRPQVRSCGIQSESNEVKESKIEIKVTPVQKSVRPNRKSDAEKPILIKSYDDNQIHCNIKKQINKIS